MIRRQMLLPACAIAALLATAPLASAATAPAPADASIEFELDADKGFEAGIQASEGKVVLTVGKDRSANTYEVDGIGSEAGLKARFGKLGLIDVTFEPTKTLNTDKPPKECTGEPWTEREGFFVGTIQFRGERDYVRIEEARAKGTIKVRPKWDCPRQKGPIRVDEPPRPWALSARAKHEAEEAALLALDRGRRCFFGAFAVRESEEVPFNIFSAAKVENREGMKITRMAFVATTGTAAFTFDHKAGTARVDPPFPFTGTATFKRRKGRDLWRSTLRVSLLGADPLRIRGRGFRVTMRLQLPGD